MAEKKAVEQEYTLPTREFVFGGKQVMFKAKLSWSEMFKFLNAQEEPGHSPEKVSRQLSLLIETWEFAGDPGKPETWDPDMGFELLAIYRTSTEYFQERTFSLGNSTGESNGTST